MTDVLNTILSRRSIRKYTQQAVSEEQLNQLLKAGMAAPSAMNGRPWEFIVVTEADPLAALRKCTRFSNYIVPAAIILCGSPFLGLKLVSEKYWIQDCSAAAENILIAATGMGLGSVWIGVYPNAGNMKNVSAALNIPEKVTPLCMIYVGYPAEEKKPRTQYDEKRVHWQKY
jgi:nitroreductase